MASVRNNAGIPSSDRGIASRQEELHDFGATCRGATLLYELAIPIFRWQSQYKFKARRYVAVNFAIGFSQISRTHEIRLDDLCWRILDERKVYGRQRRAALIKYMTSDYLCLRH